MNFKEKIKMKELKNNVKGITLIALVVTIIVLLIIAGVSINLIIGNNGIFSRAHNATSTWQMAEENEKNAINNLESWIDQTIGEDSESSGTVDPSDATAEAKDVLEGKTFYSGSDEIKTGTMTNMEGWNATINPGESVTIPEGYHNGSGTVSAENTGNVKTSIVYNANIQRATTFSRTVSGYTEYIVIYASKDNRTSSATLSATNGKISSQNDLTSVDYDDGNTSYNGRMWIINSCDKSGTTFSGTIANAAYGTRVIIIGIGT